MLSNDKYKLYYNSIMKINALQTLDPAFYLS